MDQDNLIEEQIENTEATPAIAEESQTAEATIPSNEASISIQSTLPPTPQVIEPEAQIVTESIDPQDCGCGGHADSELGFVYAIGNLYPTFPSMSIEQEYNYAYEQFKAQGPPNALFYEVLSQGQNLYIAENMCWILEINGIDTYIVKPRSNVELYHMVASLKPANVGQTKFDVIVGPRGPIAGPDMCNGIQLPTMVCNLSYDFTFSQFVDAIVSAISGVPRNVVENMLQQMLDVSDNAGETDTHRAINYLTIRCKEIYYMAWQMQEAVPAPPYPPGVFFLKSVDVQPSKVQGNRDVVDVIFTYESRDSAELAYWYVKVDVTGQFPFLASKTISRYYPAP